MKQTAQNTFADGMNLDLHPIVTPNSVLTDNLNGTFITYNGNEFCLQNDRGNVIKATLSDGFIPLGVKEHNGVLYIVSHNEKTGESEIGTYPGIDGNAKKEVWKPFKKEEYTPIKNLIKNPVGYTKQVRYVRCFASGWLPVSDNDVKYHEKINEVFDGFVDKLQAVSGGTDQQVRWFFELPMIFIGDEPAVRNFLWDVVNGVQCTDKYGRRLLTVYGEPDLQGSYDLRVGSSFLGDYSDDYHFDILYDCFQKAFEVIDEFAGTSGHELETRLQELLDKYNFGKKDYYQLFSYDGSTFEYDYPGDGSDVKWDGAEITELLDGLMSIVAAHEDEPGGPVVGTYGCARTYYNEETKTVNTTVINGDETKFEELRSTKFGFDTSHPVEIEIQDSYDGSINLIITDNKNIPYIINTEFSVNGDEYKLIKRTVKDYLVEGSLSSQLSLIKNPVSFSFFELREMSSGGRLKGGNYTFYAKLGDADGNQTDIVAESGIVSVFNGSVNLPSTMYGTLADERTDKIVRLRLNNINDGYSKVYLYYVREYSDTQGYLMEEAAMIEKPFDVLSSGSNYCNIVFTGLEDIVSISIEDLNITYHTIEQVKTMAQQQDMLFCGNIEQTTYNFEKFDGFAKQIKSSITNIGDDGVEALSPIPLDYSSIGEYYDIQNIYSKVGYGPGEYYRFGVVFILANGQNSAVFNMNGGSMYLNIEQKVFSGEGSNSYGVFKLPMQTEYDKIINTNKISPGHFKFNCNDMIQAIINEGYADIIKGYFIVRQKRIPEVITQGIHVKIDDAAHVPTLPWKLSDDSIKNVLESFVDNDRVLTYSPEAVNGAYLRPETSYRKAVQITLKGYDHPNIPWEHQDYPIILIGLIKLFSSQVVYGQRNVYVILRFSETCELQDYVVSDYIPDDMDVIETRSYGFNYDKYHSGYASITEHNDVWVSNQTSSGPGGLDPGDYYYSSASSWNKLVSDLCNNKGISLGASVAADGAIDKNSQPHSSANYFMDRLIESQTDLDSSGLLSLEAILNPDIKNTLNGQEVNYEPITNATSKSDSTYNIVGRHQSLNRYSRTDMSKTTCQAVYINSGNPGKAIGSRIFATVVGNASDPSQIATVNISAQLGSEKRNVVRGKFTPFVGLTTSLNRATDMEIPIVQLSKRYPVNQNILTRQQDSSPYYCVSKRCDILQDYGVHVYRGDCFVVTETIRMNYNFIDPTYPISEKITDPNCGRDNYRMGDNNSTDGDNINVSDLNTVSLGHGITFKCLASSNLGLRSPDPFDTVAMNQMGNPRSFYPLSGNTSTYGKQLDSELFNAGYGTTTGQVRNLQYVEVPYVKQEYENRIIFSNKHVTDEFVNGYRIFQGLSYQDYDKKYGPIVKLEPGGNNILCVFEHGISLLPVNEKALLQTTTEQTIHIYGHGVLPEQMSVVSQDYGTKYGDSVIRTPIGIYGVDVDARKIGRFSDKQGFETLSDMKIESYLNDTLRASYEIEIGKCDVRTHYNSFKGDVIFTWYVDGENYSICFNERQGLGTTRYDWMPLVSDNINGGFYSLQIGEDSDKHIGIYKHELEESRPTKWYGKQHPFEFEFVVSDPIGVHKIYENLQIISNNVQPEELQFEFIGDAYLFNKARIYHTVFENKFSDVRRGGNEITRNLKMYITDPSKREDNTTIYNKPNVERQQNENEYTPFRNASILNDRDNVPLLGRIEKTDNTTEQYHLVIPQECRNIETGGRRLGNIQYKNDSGSTTIEPILYDARLNDSLITTLRNPVTKGNSARIRDKWCKIRIRYSGEDLAVITAIKTMLNI